MEAPEVSDVDAERSVGKRLRAYLVHLYTASGVICAFLAAVHIAGVRPDPRSAFFWLFCAVVIDSTDGVLARRFKVTVYAPRIDGGTIDEIVDFLTYTFLPLLLVWRMDWLPDPVSLWVLPPMVASLFGFAHTASKQVADGFFRGFPSYWNIAAFYIGLWVRYYPGYLAGIVLLGLAVLTVLPIRFLYLTRTTGRWKWVLVTGGVLWGVLLLYMLHIYPEVSRDLFWISLAYPALYLGASVHVDRRRK
jgi:phosphatidylcholine synthase